MKTKQHHEKLFHEKLTVPQLLKKSHILFMKIEDALLVIGHSSVVHRLNIPLILYPVNWLPPFWRKVRASSSGLTAPEWCLSFQISPLYFVLLSQLISSFRYSNIFFVCSSYLVWTICRNGKNLYLSAIGAQIFGKPYHIKVNLSKWR